MSRKEVPFQTNQLKEYLIRFKLVRIQLWFEILKYLEGTDYSEWMMTELNLSTNGYAETF